MRGRLLIVVLYAVILFGAVICLHFEIVTWFAEWLRDFRPISVSVWQSQINHEFAILSFPTRKIHRDPISQYQIRCDQTVEMKQFLDPVRYRCDVQLG